MQKPQRSCSLDDLVATLEGVRGRAISAAERLPLAQELSRHAAVPAAAARSYLGVSTWQVRRWAASGVLEAVRAEPMTLSAVSVAWVACVQRQCRAYPSAVRRWVVEESVGERDAVLSTVLRGRTPDGDRPPVIDLTRADAHSR